MIQYPRRLRIPTPCRQPLSCDRSPCPLFTSNVSPGHETYYPLEYSYYSPTTPSTVGPVTPSPVLSPSGVTSFNNCPLVGLYADDEGSLNTSPHYRTNCVLTSGFSEYATVSTESIDFPVPTFPVDVTPTGVDITGHTSSLQMQQSFASGWVNPQRDYSQFHETRHHIPDTPFNPMPHNVVLFGNDGGWAPSESAMAYTSTYDVQTAQNNHQSVHLTHAQCSPRPSNSSTKKRASTPRASSNGVGRRSDSIQLSSGSSPDGGTIDKPIVRPTVSKSTVRDAARARRRKAGKYECHICPDTFTEKHGLGNHLNVHYGVKPYGCDGCNKRFTTRHTRNRHLTTCPSNQYKFNDTFNSTEDVAQSSVSFQY